MTDAQIRALKAVRDGKCERRYSARGNTMHGAPPAVLHKLANERYIDDVPARGYRTNYKLVLTDKGRMALREAEERTA